MIANSGQDQALHRGLAELIDAYLGGRKDWLVPEGEGPDAALFVEAAALADDLLRGPYLVQNLYERILADQVPEGAPNWACIPGRRSHLTVEGTQRTQELRVSLEDGMVFVVVRD